MKRYFNFKISNIETIYIFIVALYNAFFMLMLCTYYYKLNMCFFSFLPFLLSFFLPVNIHFYKLICWFISIKMKIKEKMFYFYSFNVCWHMNSNCDIETIDDLLFSLFICSCRCQFHLLFFGFSLFFFISFLLLQCEKHMKNWFSLEFIFNRLFLFCCHYSIKIQNQKHEIQSF